MQVTVKTGEQSEFHEKSSLVRARGGHDDKTVNAWRARRFTRNNK